MHLKIRIAELNDLCRIIEIYNQAVRAKRTADTEEFSAEQRRDWFQEHTPDKYPIYVSVYGGYIVGWLSISPYRKGRQALIKTAEISYYVDESYHRKGIGTSMIEHALNECSWIGIKNLFAIILETNTGSIKILEKLNFKQWGYLPDVAEFDGVKCGHVYMGINLPDILKY